MKRRKTRQQKKILKEREEEKGRINSAEEIEKDRKTERRKT